MKTLKSPCRILAVIGVIALFLSTSVSVAQPVRKKLIHAGWERPNSSDLIQYQKEIEATPYDGILLMLSGKDDAGKDVSVAEGAFTTRRWKKAWFEQNIKELRQFKSNKLTENLVRVSVSPHAPDWFDDAGWAQVVEHWKIIATIAKEGKLRGLLFDPEQYNSATLFTYPDQYLASQYSFEQYEEKVRQRGREVMQAIAPIYPDMLFFTFYMNDLNRWYAKNLDAAKYGLYPAFINGWLDAAPPQMTFVAGGESGYRYQEPVLYHEAANWVRNSGRVLVAPENWQKYRTQVQMSFGIYLDAYSYYAEGTKYYQPPLEGSRLNRLRQNAQTSFAVADEYVWTWGERYHWWPTKTKNVLPQTWEEALPGTAKVLQDAKKFSLEPSAPVGNDGGKTQVALARQYAGLLEKKPSANLLKNGDFADTSKNPGPGEGDSSAKDAPTGWLTWQKKIGGRPAGIYATDIIEGRPAVRLENMLQGFYQQSIPVEPGEKYLVRARVQRQGGGQGRLDIRWQDQKGWTKPTDYLIMRSLNTPAGQWVPLSAAVVVPEGVTKLVVLLGASSQKTGDQVWFSEAEAFRIP